MSSASYQQIKAKIEGYSNLFTLLKGISPGVEKPKVEKSTLEKLLEVYGMVKEECRDVVAVEDKLKLLLSKIDYCEKDISNLVAATQTWDLDENGSMAFGAYVGSLITILTERNGAKGKRTIIEIDENRLSYLGFCCRKFDIVRFGVNNGDCVFLFAKNGNELYVEDCKGEYFAYGVGSRGGDVGKISANTVDGKSFAYLAGSEKGRVGEIRAGTVNGKDFADGAGSKGGYVGEIRADNVNGEGFATCVGSENGRVGKISAGTVNGNWFAKYAASRIGSNGGCVDEIRADIVNGEGFAELAGSNGGHVGKIYARVVNSKYFAFAFEAGSHGGYVGEIRADVVNGNYFARHAGSDGGNVGEISANVVNGRWFAWSAGSHGHVGKISIGSHSKNAKLNEKTFKIGAKTNY